LKNHRSKCAIKQYKTTLMQNFFLNFYFLYFYLILAYYKQQQPILVDKLMSRSSALAANVDCCLTKL